MSKAETLADALMAAYTHSGLLDQNRALLRAARRGRGPDRFRIAPDPELVGRHHTLVRRDRNSGMTNPISATDVNVGLQVDLLLFDFGRTDLRIEAAKETVLSTRQTLRSIEQQVLLRAVQAFMNVRRNREFVSVRQSNVRLLRQEFARSA